MRRHSPLLVVLTLILPAGVVGAADQPKSPAVNFSRDVRPILSENCFQCHGPDENARQSDLRLDRREDAKRVLQTDGKPGGELLRRITSKNSDERMPPPSSKLALTKSQIATLQQWIRQGAPYEQHWAFQRVGKPNVPKVKNSKWPRNDVDRFILAKIEAAGLTPSERASRETLIRRLSFDLTGLPPTLAEIDAFLNDRSADAYEKVVDRLLAGPTYGERMTAAWLDVARYSDTYGYQVDRDRYVWPWRDWVVRAFNRNMPYDRFITWQLAGDLLPNATDEQILATTFNRLHPQKVEGGSVPEEFRTEYVADRIHTVATAFLGLTLECCRCHDHKFDPISQKEYYQLFAYFNNIDEAGLYSYFTKSVPTPTLRLVDEATKRRIAKLERRIGEAEKQLAALQKSRRGAFESWLQELDKKGKVPKKLIPGRIAHLDFETTNIGGNQRVAGSLAPGESPGAKAVRLTGDDAVNLKVGNFTRNQPFSVSLWMQTPDVKRRAVIFHRSRAWTDAGSRGYELLLEDGKLSAALIHFWPGNAIRVKTRQRIPTKRWLHVAVSYDGSSRADGLRIFVNGKPAETETVRDKLTKNITGGGGNHLAIGQRFRDRGFTNGLVDEFHVYNRQLTPLEVAQLHDGNSLQNALNGSGKKLSKSGRDSLFRYFLFTQDAAYRQQLAALKTLRDQRSKMVDGLREIMVMRELPEPRPTFLLTRGAYNKPGKRVFPKTPAIFPQSPRVATRGHSSAPSNRLDLAKWLTAPNHPLTARVAVNRFWQMVFGQGMVRTPEDFGSQGEPPTHPELLDWLASDFVEHDWDVKRLLKMLVMSATYQQASSLGSASSRLEPADSSNNHHDHATTTRRLRGLTPRGSPVNPQSTFRNPQFKDPENRLFARASRFRLPAEMLRDNALAVSGLLVRKIGGPPVRPYELEASFKPSKRDRGTALYRRSLYTYWKRTAPAPVMMTLDASKRDVCRVKRERTSSPLQSLVLLNSPQMVEAARVLAQRLLQKHGDKTEAVLTDLFRLLTSRRPNTAELKVITGLYQQQLSHFQKRPKLAAAFLKTGEAKVDPKLPPAELAAVAVVANTLLNFDECVMRR